MISILLSLTLIIAPGSILEQVHTVRIETSPGNVELSTAVSISPNHALALCIFSNENSVTVETDSGATHPDSFIFSPDLGLVIMAFDKDVFDSYQIPSNTAPDIGETLTIIGHEIDGVLTVESTTRERYPDGSFLLTSDIRNGLMGAAVFNGNDEYVGIITGVIRPDHHFPGSDNPEYLVLYPGQIWYMWPKLIVMSLERTEYSFGITALSSISLSRSKPSGIHIVSVSVGSRAWKTGLRPGDLITEIDGTPVYHPETLRGLLILSDDTLNATVLRNTFERTILIPPF